MHTVFRIDKITQIEDRLWQVDLTYICFKPSINTEISSLSQSMSTKIDYEFNIILLKTNQQKNMENLTITNIDLIK
jgi:hypothetical protein